jgi:hypothetical protein
VVPLCLQPQNPLLGRREKLLDFLAGEIDAHSGGPPPASCNPAEKAGRKFCASHPKHVPAPRAVVARHDDISPRHCQLPSAEWKRRAVLGHFGRLGELGRFTGKQSSSSLACRLADTARVIRRESAKLCRKTAVL